MTTQTTHKKAVAYPESDGEPIAENTLQFEYITTIKWGLDAVFCDDPSVFVAGDLLWYPVEGHPEIRTAPDVMVVFGRPKGHRGSYQQWREDGIPAHVVFEILSPGNRFTELLNKFHFYQRHGVQEYYVYDPDRAELSGWLGSDGEFREIPEMTGWTSPRLGVRFELVDDELHLHDHEGRRFATYLELVRQRHELLQRAEHESQRAERESQRAERMAARLRALGADPEE